MGTEGQGGKWGDACVGANWQVGREREAVYVGKQGGSHTGQGYFKDEEY